VDPELSDFRASLYEREVAVGYQPGTVLLYRHDLWHRGTPLLPKDGLVRYIQVSLNSYTVI
jgi:hypothetical protein